MIRFEMKYAEELRKDTERIRENWEINYTIDSQSIIKMKNGYREMAQFNQDYSEIGLGDDILSLQFYEDSILKGGKDED